jgi:hypothetical protein
MNNPFAFLTWHGRLYAGYFEAWSAALAGKQGAGPQDSERAAEQRWETEGGAPMLPALANYPRVTGIGHKRTKRCI